MPPLYTDEPRIILCGTICMDRDRRDTTKMSLDEINRLRRKHTTKIETSHLNELLHEMQIEAEIDACVEQRQSASREPRS